MLSNLKIKNFTVFQNADLQFSKHLNVIIGENGSGKTHLLKVAYSALATSWAGSRKPTSSTPTKALMQTRLAEKLINVYGRFYLKDDRGRFEMPLVAEGQRKLAMLARLIATGALIDNGFLFWDEPEANLNPLLIKAVAQSIVSLSKTGIQVFLATHSLFLLRELEIVMAEQDNAGIDSRFFGLHFVGDSVVIEQGDTIDEIGDIAALDEELAQSDRFIQDGASV